MGGKRTPEQRRAYSQRPEVKARAQARRQTPEWKAWMKEHRQTPEYKEVVNERRRIKRSNPENNTLENKRRREKSTPEFKTLVNARRQTPEAKSKRHSRRWSPQGRYSYMMHTARARNKDCTITREEYFSILPPNGAPCPICGAKMWYGDKRHCPSNDRRDNSKDYVSGNIAIICFECNSTKLAYDATRLYRLGMYAQGLIG